MRGTAGEGIDGRSVSRPTQGQRRDKLRATLGQPRLYRGAQTPKGADKANAFHRAYRAGYDDIKAPSGKGFRERRNL
jgi:hypothetical protein